MQGSYYVTSTWVSIGLGFVLYSSRFSVKCLRCWGLGFAPVQADVDTTAKKAGKGKDAGKSKGKHGDKGKDKGVDSCKGKDKDKSATGSTSVMKVYCVQNNNYISHLTFIL